MATIIKKAPKFLKIQEVPDIYSIIRDSKNITYNLEYIALNEP